MGYSRPTIPPMIRPEAQVAYVMNNLAEFAYSPAWKTPAVNWPVI